VPNINQHATSGLQFLAVELQYIADDGFEILLPAVYDEESIQSKGTTTTPKRQWDEQGVLTALAKVCSPEGFAAARQLYDYAKVRAVGFTWSVGPYPSVTFRLPIGGRASSALSLYEWPQGKRAFAINFEYMTGYATDAALGRLAGRLREIPGFGEYLVGLEQAEFRKRPSLPIDGCWRRLERSRRLRPPWTNSWWMTQGIESPPPYRSSCIARSARPHAKLLRSGCT
jgi:hypothetical protein